MVGYVPIVPGLQTSRGGRERQIEDEIIIPTDVGRKQMLVRVLPHQTQVVVLEGPVLVEHYVAGQDRASAVGNIYLGKVRNVLPGHGSSIHRLRGQQERSRLRRRRKSRLRRGSATASPASKKRSAKARRSWSR